MQSNEKKLICLDKDIPIENVPFILGQAAHVDLTNTTQEVRDEESVLRLFSIAPTPIFYCDFISLFL